MCRVLPRVTPFAHQHPIPGIGIRIQIRQILDHFGPQRVQVNGAHQFQLIGVFLALDGFVAILKQVAAAVMSSIKADHITGQQPAHQGGQGNIAGSEKEKGVIGHEGPGVAADSALG